VSGLAIKPAALPDLTPSRVTPSRLPCLGLVFEAEVKGRGPIEVGVEEDVEDGLDQVGLAAAVAADHRVEEMGLLEDDLTVAQVLEAVDPKAAQLHRLGVPSARWRAGCGEFFIECFEEVLGGGAGGGEVGFQLVD